MSVGLSMKRMDVTWQLENALDVCNHGEVLYDKQRKDRGYSSC